MLLIFSVLYAVVSLSISASVRNILKEEIQHHVNYVKKQPVFTRYIEEGEWNEIEHADLELNPVFISIYNKDFQLVEQSPNLKEHHLKWQDGQPEFSIFSVPFNGSDLLISQAVLVHNHITVGYIVIGVSMKNQQMVLTYLQLALWLIFPLSLGIIFLTARFIASKSIAPVFTIISTARTISENHLSQRIELPSHEDELHTLTVTINSLLDRLEFQLQKARQFSADASHELRTPLAVIKGTLEILIRKQRTIEEYENKIGYTLKQADRLSQLVEQFLLLARIENDPMEIKKSNLHPEWLIRQSVERYQVFLKEKQIQLSEDYQPVPTIYRCQEYLEIIMDNLLSNAIKFVNPKGIIRIALQKEENQIVMTITDNGIGISPEELHYITNRYYRAENVKTNNIKGSGLGLHIAYKLAQLDGNRLEIESLPGKGTEVRLIMPFEN